MICEELQHSMCFNYLFFFLQHDMYLYKVI